jgi:bifunctional DNase/RNase
MRRVEVTGLADNTFHARLLFEQAGHELAVDIRPSDAVALAVRIEAPIYVAEAVLNYAGIVPQAAPAGSEAEVELDESKLSRFKEFIETLDIDDLDPRSPEQRHAAG